MTSARFHTVRPVRPIRATILKSLVFPLFGAGMLHVVVLTAFLSFLRLLAWFLGGFAPGFSTAAAFIFGLLASSYVARLLLVNVESSAEGFDDAPVLPDPREVEELFGGLLRLAGVGFFTMLPLLLAGILNFAVGALSWALLALGAAYFPAGLLGVAVRPDVGSCFPDTAGAAMRASGARYLFPAVLSIATALLVGYSHAGAGARLPLPALLGFDLASGWFLLSVAHGIGLAHRDLPQVRKAVPFPPPAPELSERTTPPRPATEIERILSQRLRREEKSRRTPPPTRIDGV